MPKHRIPHLLYGAKNEGDFPPIMRQHACPNYVVCSAQEARRGTVVGVDEATGSITIQQPQAGTVGAASPATPPDRYAVKDGLLFNALRAGDKVTFSSQEISGVKTITQRQKE